MLERQLERQKVQIKASEKLNSTLQTELEQTQMTLAEQRA
jgi:hypothetical protein